MHLQNHGRLLANGFAVIAQRRLVRGAHFPQLRAAGFKNFGNAEPAPNLDQLAAGNDDFLLLAGGKMPKHEQQRRGTVVGDGGGFRAAEQREIMFQISRAPASLAAGQVKFEIVVTGGGGLERFDHGRAERRAPEVGVNNNARAVDDRLDARRAQGVKGGTDAIEHAVEFGNLFLRAQRSQFAADDGHDRWTRQINLAERLKDSFHGGNISPALVFSACCFGAPGLVVHRPDDSWEPDRINPMASAAALRTSSFGSCCSRIASRGSAGLPSRPILPSAAAEF